MLRRWWPVLLIAALAFGGTGSSCAGAKPRPTGHATCADATAARAKLGCKFQDGFAARCAGIGSDDFNACVVAAGSCGEIDNCDPALHKQ